MIQKLLDELYWDQMEEDISLFFKDRGGQGLYCSVGDEKRRVSGFLTCLISLKVSRLENHYFGKPLLADTVEYPTSSFIRVDQISKYIDLNEVKSEIVFCMTKFRGAIYKPNPLVHVLGYRPKVILFRELPSKKDLVYLESVSKVKSAYSIDEAFRVLEALVTHKITTSSIYMETLK